MLRDPAQRQPSAAAQVFGDLCRRLASFPTTENIRRCHMVRIKMVLWFFAVSKMQLDSETLAQAMIAFWDA
ncbi:hypothetical protein [Novosphingobium terrae]|uniref:hypothetical protein n=1 Tax=Novosphingobium terrae TaxID=2726189 RepID=UPI0019801951|nr:hypothetical protein [Novosphingobium terrae]